MGRVGEKNFAMIEAAGRQRSERRSLLIRGVSWAMDDQKARGATRAMERIPKPPELMGKEKVLRAASLRRRLIFATEAAAPIASLSNSVLALESRVG